MAANDVYQSDMWFSLQGDDVNINTIFSSVSGDGLDNEASLNAYIIATVLPAIALQQDDTILWNCVETKKIWESATTSLTTSIAKQVAISPPITGPSPGAALPAQVSMVVQTLPDDDEASPSRRGRDFFTGFDCGKQTDGAWNDVDALNVGLAIQSTLMGGFTGVPDGTYNWVNFSFKLAKVADPSPQTVIETIRILKQCRTQRRRQPRNPCDKYAVRLP